MCAHYNEASSMLRKKEMKTKIGRLGRWGLSCKEHRCGSGAHVLDIAQSTEKEVDPGDKYKEITRRPGCVIYSIKGYSKIVEGRKICNNISVTACLRKERCLELIEQHTVVIYTVDFKVVFGEGPVFRLSVSGCWWREQ